MKGRENPGGRAAKLILKKGYANVRGRIQVSFIKNIVVDRPLT